MDANNVLNYLPATPANPFDVFDTVHPASGLSPRYAGVYGDNAQVQPLERPANPFDKFDGHAQAGPDNAIESGVRHFLSGAMFGLSDPAVAAVQASGLDPFEPVSQADSWSDRYHENLAALRAVGMSDQIVHPIASFTGEIAGGLANPANRFLGEVRSVGDAARVGGQLGLAHGIGTGIADDQGVDHIADSGLRGAALGGLTGGALGGVAGAVSRKLLRPDVVNLPGIKRAAQAAYDAADSSGAIVSKDAMANMADDLTAKLANEGLDATLHPQATASYSRLQNAAGNNYTWKGLDILRRQAADAVNAAGLNKSDQRVAYLIRDHLDDFVNDLQPSDLVTGSASPAALQGAIGNLQRARSLWRAYSQGSVIQDNINKAALKASSYSQSGEENALRNQFLKLAMNDRAMMRLDPDVRAAVRTVAKGTALNTALRNIGRYAPHGPVATSAGLGLGYMLGGLSGAASGGLSSLAVPAIGELARIGATAARRAAANNALRLAAKLPEGVTAPGGLRSLSGLQYRTLQAARQLPKLTAAVVPLAVGQ
jgi:hypothetical protein